MLIRCRGYNNGVKEYLEEGIKSGREYSRNELDERVIIDGDLNLTEMIYQNIPDKGQDRYLTYTLSFREDEISEEDLFNITSEFKSFLMNAYQDDEFNFYAEAHIPKIKYIPDKRTGEHIERKPHIHIVIPRVNLLSGKEANPVGMHKSNEKYMEAFQEYINQKYKLASPRDHIRFNPNDSANILSRYKGDDFYNKNRGVKAEVIQAVIDRNITSREGFYKLVSEYGETKIRNKGKDNEYIAVKLPGDAKYTNLKETIFNDDFIVNRQLKKPPLDKKIINERLLAWPQRAKEIKYVSKAAKGFREKYQSATPEHRQQLLIERENQFYKKHRGLNELHTTERSGDHQRSVDEARGKAPSRTADSLQNMRSGNVAIDGESGQSEHSLLLQDDAHVRVGQQEPGRSSGLRYVVPGRGGRGNDRELDTNKFTAISGAGSTGNRGTGGYNDIIPVYARSPYRVATIQDIEKRGQQLFSQFSNETAVTPLKISLKPARMINVNRQASTVAANFLRQLEHNQLLPAQRSAIRRIDQQFYSLRRNVFSDDRLTRDEKTQFISILTFERLKAKEAVKTPNHEELPMGSSEIRDLLKRPTERLPENSISSGEESPKPVRERITNLLERLRYKANEPSSEEKQRQLTAGDLYTKRARLSQHVHYVDKQSDKTMFVDTGKSIAMRKNGMTVDSVAVALQLAKEKFGSSLTIKGSTEFKNQVIEAVAVNGMDIHFTDKEMNKQLEQRKAELEIERSGQTIEEPKLDTPSEDVPGMDENVPDINAQDDYEQFVKDAYDIETRNQGTLLKHGTAPYLHDDKNSDSYFVVLSLSNGGEEKTYWGAAFKEAVEASQAREGDIIKLHDNGTETVHVPEQQEDGSMVDVPHERRLWSVEVVEWAVEEVEHTYLE
jgi:hypothetical protein